MSTVAVAAGPLLSAEENPQQRPREASFSFYLSGGESFALRLEREFADFRGAAAQITVGAGRPSAAAAADDELDVFPAEKYFSGGVDLELERPWKKTPTAGAGVASRNSLRGPPSVCSEASGNSRSALLKDSARAAGQVSPRNSRPPARRKLLRLFRCACSDKASVEVHEAGGFDGYADRAHPVRQENWARNAGPSPAILPPPIPVPAGKPAIGGSIRVPSARLGRPSVVNFSSGAGANAGDDDRCSESSSELFEIESISTGTLAIGWEGGGASAAACGYAPSEASIEWSVVTASAANFSAVSDGEASPPPGKQPRRRRAGGALLGCGGAKAVMPRPPADRRHNGPSRSLSRPGGT